MLSYPWTVRPQSQKYLVKSESAHQVSVCFIPCDNTDENPDFWKSRNF